MVICTMEGGSSRALTQGRVRFVVAAVDYFTKWVEVEALATITANVITRFLRKVIVCGFVIP